MDAFDEGRVIDWKPPQTAAEALEARQMAEAREEEERYVAMVMPDGSTQPLPTIDVRATEYTVGETGPNAMPGLLPNSSGYTYAVELSVDEAVTAGARSVEFDRPVPVYVDNFLQLPVGVRVPLAFYDRTTAAWIPNVERTDHHDRWCRGRPGNDQHRHRRHSR